MTNKARLALIATVAALSVVSTALAQSQIVSPPNTAVPEGRRRHDRQAEVASDLVGLLTMAL